MRMKEYSIVAELCLRLLSTFPVKISFALFFAYKCRLSTRAGLSLSSHRRNNVKLIGMLSRVNMLFALGVFILI